MASSKLSIVITGEDKASGVLKKTESALGGLGKVAVGVAAGLGVAAVGAGVASINMAGDFEKGMREVATLSDSAEANMAGLSDGVLDLSKRLGTDAVGSTKALYQAISAGVPTDNAISFLEVASKAAIGGVTDTETAVDGLTTVMNAFKAQGLDAGKAADIMFSTVKAGKTDFAQLSGSMSNVAPIAAAMGVNFEEVAASIATLTSQGVPTAQATTQMRAAMVGLAKPSAELTRIFQEAGFESGELALKEAGLTKASEILAAATGGSVSEMTKLVGSQEAVSAILGITGDQAATQAANLDSMANSAGNADKAFDLMSQGMDQQLKKLGSTVQTTFITIGSKLLPIITPIIAALAGGLAQAFDAVMSVAEPFITLLTTSDLSAATDAFESLSAVLGPEMAQTILNISQGIRGLIEAISTGDMSSFSQAMTSLFGPEVAGTITMIVEKVREFSSAIIEFVSANPGAAITALAVVLGGILVAGALAAAGALWAMMAPMIPIVLAIAAVAAAVFLLKTAWDENFLGIQEVTQQVGAVIGQVWDFVTKAFSAAWSAIEPILAAVFAELARFWNEIAPKLREAWDTMMSIIQVAHDTIMQIVVAAMTFLVGFIRDNWTTIQATIDGILQFIGSILSAFWVFVSSLFSAALSALSGDWEGAWNTIMHGAVQFTGLINQAIEAMWQAIGSAFETGKNLIFQVWGSLWSSIQSALANAVAGIKSAIRGVLNDVIGMVNGAIGAINGAIGAVVGGVNNVIADAEGSFNVAASLARGLGIPMDDVSLGRISAPQLPTIPQLAHGGIVTAPTLAMIGEAGPEAVVPLSRGARGVGTEIHIHVAGSVISERDLVNAVYDGLLKRQKRDGALGLA